MAEFLVIAKRHHMDDWTPEQVAAMAPEDKKRRYDSRAQPGDIESVRPDGFYTSASCTGWGAPDYALVVVPGLSMSTAREYAGKPILDADGLLIRKFRFRIRNVDFLTQKRVDIPLANIFQYIDEKVVT